MYFGWTLRKSPLLLSKKKPYWSVQLGARPVWFKTSTSYGGEKEGGLKKEMKKKRHIGRPLESLLEILAFI